MSVPKVPDTLPKPDLLRHLFELAQQVSIALGDTENPLTRKREANLPVARYLIDTIAMLDEKTAGNRTDEEDQYLSGVLTNLRMAYVQKTS
ncbi:MAG: DUF1844 domain-containing protein [Planctomycetes bacterium]|nr:DUF1844 domain-containing protein [Planctomycetota bacterium]